MGVMAFDDYLWGGGARDALDDVTIEIVSSP